MQITYFIVDPARFNDWVQDIEVDPFDIAWESF